MVTMTSSISSEDYERLALEMLAVEAGDFADVKDAMRKIIASAPDGADVAFLLSRALAHAGDRASKGEVHESERPRNTVAMVERLPLDRRSQRVSWPDCYRASETRCEE